MIQFTNCGCSFQIRRVSWHKLDTETKVYKIDPGIKNSSGPQKLVFLFVSLSSSKHLKGRSLLLLLLTLPLLLLLTSSSQPLLTSSLPQPLLPLSTLLFLLSLSLSAMLFKNECTRPEKECPVQILLPIFVHYV